MKQSSLFIFSLIFILGLGLYFLSPLSRTDETSVSDSEMEDEVPPETSETSPLEQEGATLPADNPPKVDSQAPPAANVQKIFANTLRSLGQCLDTQNSVPGEELEPSLRTLVDSIRGEWGESVISTEDWMQVDLETPEGEKRRIRVEMDFDNETQIQRKLKYVTVESNGETRPISVPEDQAVEPSDSLIASLEAGNNILTREKFERVYFQNGEEIVARQTNGFISELEVNKGTKSFKCKSVNTEASACQCL